MNFFRRFRLSRDRSVTVANLVDELLRRDGDCEVSVEEEGQLSACRAARGWFAIDAFLRRTVGLAPGQPVAIYRTNDRQCFHWFLAVIRAGGIAVPLNPMLTLSEVKRILENSGTEILVTDKAVFERNIGDRERAGCGSGFRRTTKRKRWMDFYALATRENRFPPTAIDPAATVAIFHTSGTSGFPRAPRFPAAHCSGRAHPR